MARKVLLLVSFSLIVFAGHMLRGHSPLPSLAMDQRAHFAIENDALVAETVFKIEGASLDYGDFRALM